MSILAGFTAVCLWGMSHFGQSERVLSILGFQVIHPDGAPGAPIVPPPVAPVLPVVPVVPPLPQTIAEDPTAPTTVSPAIIVDVSLPPIVIPPDLHPASAESSKLSASVPAAPAAPPGSRSLAQGHPSALPPLFPVPPPHVVPPPADSGPSPMPLQPPSTAAPWPKLPPVPPPGSETPPWPKPGNIGNPSPVSPPLATPQPVPTPQPAPIVGSQLPEPQPQKPPLQVPPPPEPPQTTPRVQPPIAPSVQVPTTGAPRYVILKNNKLVVGQVRLEGDEVVIRQGALDRRWSKAEVITVVKDAQAVWQTLRKQIPDENLAARLALARWLMFQGLREQALAEARAIVQQDPQQKQAQDLARSLELSLQQFPSSKQAPSSTAGGQMLADWSHELHLTTQGILSFANQAQPVLANQCMDCHARSDYHGPFRLTRVSGLEVGWQHTWQNLRAVAAQLNRQEPVQSPLLRKALSAHGPMKQPAFLSPQSPGYKALEAWVLSAVPHPAPAAIPPTYSEEIPPPPGVIPPAKTEDTSAAPLRLPSPSPTDKQADSGSVPNVPLPVVPPPALPQVPMPTPVPSRTPSAPSLPLPAVPLPLPQPDRGDMPPTADEFDPVPYHMPPSDPRR